jgi:hypothetical protein
MRSRSSGAFLLALVLALGAAACSSAPLTPTGTASVTTPGLASPADGAQIASVAQPVTLTINNATVTGAASGVTYTFEVANDVAFTSKFLNKDVPQTSGQTSLKLDTLPPGKDYYWHVRTTSAGTVGTFTSALKFTIGAAIVINAPTPVSPQDGATTPIWPALTVINAAKTGPFGSIVYRFEVATTTAFSTIIAFATVPETPGQTSFRPLNAIPDQATQYFWRATAIDQTNGVSSQVAATQSFTVDGPKTPQAKLAAEEGLALWPGVQPPGLTGHSALGDNWSVKQLVSHGGVHFTSPPIEALQIFDLIDRGLNPQAAIDWRNANGYPRAGAYYPTVGLGVIGIDYMYMALNPYGAWDLVLRAE